VTAPAGLPRLLPPDGGTEVRLEDHLRRVGPVPDLSAEGIIEITEAAGLTGRGGAGFPTHRKLRAVAAGRSTVVVGNGAEGEPASGKDAMLLASAPHLVIDGLELAARAVGARKVFLYVEAGSPALATVRDVLAERNAGGSGRFGSRRGAPGVTLVEAPARFLSGEESAVASRVSGGPAMPRDVPPRVFERGVDGRPTLVQNVETLAHLALAVRFGSEWFRSLGTATEPGSALFTLGGAVQSPTVIEASLGTSVRALVDAAGGPTERLQALLFGGYHGAWLSAVDAHAAVLTSSDLRARGAVLGAGVVLALPASACGVRETARVVRYLADQSAGQCGPCRFGLPALAQALDELAGPGVASHQLAQLDRWTAMVEHRGACHHPDGTVRFLRSARGVFGDEFELHAHGHCSVAPRSAVLPVPVDPAVSTVSTTSTTSTVSTVSGRR
jgi:NADH:ubiquinone oxidoreductase subunit F (NADH-binding)